MTQRSAYWAVVPAAGVGRRMGGQIPKQYLPLLDRTVIECALQPLLDHELITRVVVALSSVDEYWVTLPVAQHPKILTVVGGDERCRSVMNGLSALEQKASSSDWVLVHDAARPCLRSEDLNKLIQQVSDDGAGALLATPVHDTVKRAQIGGRVDSTVDRSMLWRAYTPQIFQYNRLKDALIRSVSESISVTDEASAMEAQGYHPQLVEGHSDNIKVTCPEDLKLAEFYLSSRY